VQPLQLERVDYGTAAAALFDHLLARQAPPNSPRAKVAARAVTVKQGQPPSRAMFCARKRANLRQRRE